MPVAADKAGAVKRLPGGLDLPERPLGDVLEVGGEAGARVLLLG